ncbi:hypothetical protein [Streptomyces sp. NPDC054863]
MRIRHTLTAAGLGAALTLATLVAPAAASTPTSTSTLTPTSDSAPSAAVRCYLYVSSAYGYYNVRTAKDPLSGLIKRYTGKRLPAWPGGCGEVVGKKYRCAQGQPEDNSWVPVDYNGRKGWVAANCAGGLGA